MPSLDNFIDNQIVLGDSWRLTRNIGNLEEAIEKAWFLIKLSPNHTDAQALLAKEITETDSASGQIESAYNSDGSADVRFEFGPPDGPNDYDNLVAGRTYYYDIQNKMISGKIYTPESGRIRFKHQITRATT